MQQDNSCVRNMLMRKSNLHVLFVYINDYIVDVANRINVLRCQRLIVFKKCNNKCIIGKQPSVGLMLQGGRCGCCMGVRKSDRKKLLSTNIMLDICLLLHPRDERKYPPPYKPYWLYNMKHMVHTCLWNK